ncbi:MAG: hypothetical protein ACSLE7_17040, partial [Mycobacterium sp.]
SNESAADSGTRRTLPAGYDSTAPANSGPQPRLHADCPVKIEEPINPPRILQRHELDPHSTQA